METPRMLRSRRYYVGMLGALPVISVLGATGRIAAACGMTNVQSFGAKGDGVKDDTNALQNACNSGQVLYFPKTSAFYKTSHFLDLSNSVYSNGAEIRLKQDGTTSTAILRVVTNAAPLTIDGFILNGLYSGGTANEYSPGIDLLSAVNVTVSNNIIKNTYGDSVYIGHISTVPSKTVTIINNVMSNPRRCNVAVTFADTVLISNNILNKTVDYVMPIDLEPNIDGFSYVRNVTISGNTIDCPVTCIDASTNNGIPNSGLVINNNTATGLQLLITYTGLLSGAMISSNTFRCKNPLITTPVQACMFDIENTTRTSSTLSNNIDMTVRAGSYKSLYQSASTLTLTNNTFIT